MENLLAYTAGFIDGEGCLSLLTRTRRASGRVHVTAVLIVVNCNRAPLERFQALFGGPIHDVALRNEFHRVQYSWQIQGAALRATLAAITPLLLIKKEQAELILEFLASKDARATSHGKRLTDEQYASDIEFVRRIRQLNKRGTREE